MELKDEEIKKELEQHIRIANYVDSIFCDNVSVDLLQKTIDLINRQQAEIERLPCKVEDIVYQVDTLFDETTITELKVIELTIDSNGIKTLYGTTNKGSVYCFNRGYNLNNIKFTKEEAERALKGGVHELRKQVDMRKED